MCDFCDAIERNKRFDRIMRQGDFEYSRKYSVAIVQRIFFKGSTGSQGISTDYRHHGCGYKLNYCPECGKKMDGGASNG